MPRKKPAKAVTLEEPKTDATSAPVPEKEQSVEEIRAQIREEEAEKFRAASADRARAEKERQDALDAKRKDFVRVTCIKDKSHTSSGRMRLGQSRSIHKDEAALLEDAGCVTID